MCRYEDGDVEFCTFHTKKIDANKSQRSFKQKLGVEGSVEMKKIAYTKKGYIDLLDRYAIKYKINCQSIVDEFEEVLYKFKNRQR